MAVNYFYMLGSLPTIGISISFSACLLLSLRLAFFAILPPCEPTPLWGGYRYTRKHVNARLLVGRMPNAYAKVARIVTSLVAKDLISSVLRAKHKI